MDKFFKITEHGSTVKTEIIAGLTTFFAMAYIIFVNPNQVTGFSSSDTRNATVLFLHRLWLSMFFADILVTPFHI